MRFFSIYFNLFFKSYSYTYRILTYNHFKTCFCLDIHFIQHFFLFCSTPSLLTPSRKRVVLSSSSQFPDLSKATSHTCAAKQFFGLEFPCSMANLLRGRCWELARGHELVHFEGLSKESTSRPLEKNVACCNVVWGGRIRDRCWKCGLTPFRHPYPKNGKKI